MNKFEAIKNKLNDYKAEYLLRFYDELDVAEQSNLLSTIEEVDFEELNKINERIVESTNFTDVSPFEDVIEADKMNSNEKEIYHKIAEETIRTGKSAICIMAGGQGSRLGHIGPKGTFMVDLGNNNTKSIFELCISNILKAKEKYGVCPYCFIMTSTLNHVETVDFFEKNNYFGYDKSKIMFFMQGKMPLTDLDGNIVLENKSSVYLAPNGNGGIFKALDDNKVLSLMEDKGIEYLYITNVDNILTNPYEETILGNLVSSHTQLGVKTLLKKNANEKVGVCCQRDGKFLIVEYIDLPKEFAEKTLEDGSIAFKDSYFGTCYLSLELLKKIAREKLPYHKAKKKNEYIDKNGVLIKAEEVNSIKYEMFIFDGFFKADSVKLYRVKREDEFAPIKGKEDIEEAVKLYNNKM